MSTRIQVKRLRNPKRRAKVNRKRRKMTPKQIRHFGTKAQRAALKRRRKSNPAPRKNRARARVHRKRRRRPNPAPVILTLGAMNPRRKRRNTKMAAKKVNRKRRRRVTRNPKPVARRRNTKRRSNTRVIVVTPKANRRRNPRRRVVNTRRRRHHSRRRNPLSTTVFGAPIFGRKGMEIIAGGLAGVAGAKFLPTLLPASVTATFGNSNITRTIITGIAAVVGGFLGTKVSPEFGQGVIMGGMMQTFSVALNGFFPSVYAQISPQLGFGDLMPGGFSVPQNPLRLPPPPVAAPSTLPPAGAQARMTMNGLARAYGSAF